jgi:hypothetical protein
MSSLGDNAYLHTQRWLLTFHVCSFRNSHVGAGVGFAVVGAFVGLCVGLAVVGEFVGLLVGAAVVGAGVTGLAVVGLGVGTTSAHAPQAGAVRS